ncbi:hypothetical protein [Bradyrhizobium erythrophlei]|uniref:Uncharacterized protein n=1 Tax=Bradyrhizobium erythrophlei TaxID=1437360 RepID=A0A1H4NYT6_9BRAD|nr:hypothetical protein [Bradyrhizobium erythrophlei]SEC00360.1 hypothetical protein SAMN05444164_0772 [Bradyrhizobium erythrophlei]
MTTRLADLDPRWVMKNGSRVGFTFRCPTDPRWRQLCKVVPLSTREQWSLLSGGEDGHEAEHTQTARHDVCWTIKGGIEAAEFDTLTVMPSIDGSAGGLWHGFITNGEVR